MTLFLRFEPRFCFFGILFPPFRVHFVAVSVTETPLCFAALRSQPLRSLLRCHGSQFRFSHVLPPCEVRYGMGRSGSGQTDSQCRFSTSVTYSPRFSKCSGKSGKWKTVYKPGFPVFHFSISFHLENGRPEIISGFPFSRFCRHEQPILIYRASS